MSNWEIFQKFDKKAITQFSTPQRSIYNFGMTAFHFLIVDVQEQQPSDLLEDSAFFHELLEDIAFSPDLFHITHSILQSLHLHSRNGISFERTYSFRIPCRELRHYKSEYNLPNIRFWASELDRLSVLPEKRFDDCKNTFSSLLIKRTLQKSTYRHFLYMVLRYHQATFNMAEFSHKFLILMVIFESIFKREDESNSGQAALRISKLISKVKSEQKGIQENFFGNQPDGFCKIRNLIAHGDPSLNEQIVESRYPLLYKYVTKAIIKFIEIPSGAIDYSKNYYDEIERYINSHYITLPSS